MRELAVGIFAKDHDGDENFNVYAIDPTAAADPEEDPPVTWAVFQGFLDAPK